MLLVYGIADSGTPEGKALDGSVALAKYMGVPTGEILDSYDKITSYFLD